MNNSDKKTEELDKEIDMQIKSLELLTRPSREFSQRLISNMSFAWGSRPVTKVRPGRYYTWLGYGFVVATAFVLIISTPRSFVPQAVSLNDDSDLIAMDTNEAEIAMQIDVDNALSDEELEMVELDIADDAASM